MPDGSTTTTTDKNKKFLEFIEDITSNTDQVQQPPPVQRPPSPQPDSLRLLYTRVLQQVGVAAMTPRPSNFNGVEIYSVSSSSNQTPRGSNFLIPSGRLLNLGGTELGKLSGRPDHDDDIVASTDQPETKGVGEADEEALHPKEDVDVNTGKQMPPARVMTRLILVMVWWQLIRNLNTYSSLIGLVWSLISFGIVYGTPTKDNSMREFSSRVFDGYEIRNRTNGDGNCFHQRWSLWYPLSGCHRPG